MPKYLNQIPEPSRTHWEREYNAKRPYHFYKILDGWDAIDRDFMAYWNGRLQDALDEYGHPSARPVVEIDRWFAPIVRGDVKPVDAPDERWNEYDKATTGGGGRTSVRTHVDGRILNEQGETVGRWKEPEGSILDKVKGWAQETYHGEAHVRRWNQVLTALGHDTGERAMTLEEAEQNLARFKKDRWQPVVDAMRATKEDSPDEPYQYGIDLTEALETCAAEGKFQWYLYIQAEMGTYVAQYSGQAPGFPIELAVCDAITARFPKVYMTKMRAFA